MKRKNLPGSKKTAAADTRRGAPCGNANALKHGKYTRARRALLAEIRIHIRRGHALRAAVTRAMETGYF